MQTNLTQLIKNTRNIRSYFSPFTKDDRSYFLFMCLLLVGITIANALMIWYVGAAVNALTNSQFGFLGQVLVTLAIIVGVNQLMQYGYFYIFEWAYLRMVARVRETALFKVMELSYPATAKFKKGDLLARLTNDIDRLQTFMFDAPLNLFSHILVLIVYVSMLFWIDWKLALIALALSPLFYLLQRILVPLKGIAADHFYNRNGELIAFEEQTINNLRGVSSFGVEKRMRNVHHSVFDIARHWTLKMRAIDILYDRIIIILIYLSGVFIVYMGIEEIESGRLMIGTLVSFIVYLGYLSVPIRGLAQLPIQVRGDENAARRVMQLMDAENNVDTSPDASPLEVTKGEIQFHNIDFAYPRATEKVFKQFSETIKHGESVALVGPSGSGKSTLASLLLRFFDPQHGSITIDGIDLKFVSLESLRKNVAIVWQEPFFINDTIRENLRLANEHASDEQMIQACKSSYAWEYIQNFDRHLDTIIGTHGVSLSVGQFQRLAIAQAFLRDAPILVLDEASSALDSHSEQKIVEALQKLREGRTTIVIAHRYSSIRSSDRVLYLNGDGTATSGSHEALLSTHPGYKQAVEWQTTLGDTAEE